MTRIDYLNDRIEACGCFSDSMSMLSSSDSQVEYLLEADSDLARGIADIRCRLRNTQYSDELTYEDTNDTITFILKKVVVGDSLVNAFIKLTYISPTSYKILFCETSKILVNKFGEEYLA